MTPAQAEHAAPRRVLFVASRAEIAGGEKYLLSVMRHLDRRRYEPLVLVPGAGAFAEALAGQGVECIVMTANYGWLAPAQEWVPFLAAVPERVRALAALLRDRGVAVVHTNSNQVLDGMLAARLAGVHHVYAAHIEFQPALAIFQRVPLAPASFAALMAELSSHVVAVSRQVAQVLAPVVPADRVSVIHNGLEIEAFDAALAAPGDGFRRELGLGAGDVLVTAVGRVHPDKGFDLLLDAALPLLAEDRRVHLAVVGSVDDAGHQAALAARIAASGCGGRVHLVPFRGDVPQVLVQSDLFVLSSRREGHPFVLLEAMACGRAVVATRCGGVEETVVEGETGFTVPIGDAAAMASAIRRLVADADLRQRMGRAGAARLRAEFSAARMVASLQHCYDAVLAGPRPLPGSVAVDLLLQACTEFAALGRDVLDLKERMKRVERAADLVLDNPVAAAARRLGRLGRR